MKKNLKERAITLIALVVTIIILLILAGVTVGFAVNGSGLFEKAKLATDEYNNSVEKENIELEKATNEIINLTSNRQIENKEYGYFKADSISAASNQKILINKIDSNMDFDSTNNTVKLLNGKHYYIEISFRATASNTSTYGDVNVHNETDNADIFGASWAETGWNYNSERIIYTTTKDINISLKNVVHAGGGTVKLGEPKLIIYEI